MQNRIDVLMIIKTTGLHYDDRLRKESLSATALGQRTEIIALEQSNIPGRKVVYECVPARTIQLVTRRLFKQSKGNIFKTCEMYMKMFWQVINHRVRIVWLHDLEMVGLVPLLWVLKKFHVIHHLIWDQHELPSDKILASKRSVALLIWIMNLCDIVIIANHERRKLIEEKGAGCLRTQMKVLHNYPDGCFCEKEKIELPYRVSKWLQNTQYLLAQGGAGKNRKFDVITKAIMILRSFKLVVVGPYQEEDITELDEQYGSLWNDYIYFTSFVPQMEMQPFIDHAMASLIFYTTKTINNRLCASNRMYQACCRGVPVIVGQNPPMADFVNKYQCGIVVDHDDEISICDGIKKIWRERAEYLMNAEAAKREILWENEHHKIADILNINTQAQAR